MSNEYQVRVFTAPAVEPVSLAEAKIHLRVDHSDDDAHISALITTAREYCEMISRRAFVNRTLDLSLSGWPADGYIRLPYPPAVSVSSITYYKDDNTSATLSAADYILIADIDPAVVALAKDKSWPSDSLRTVAPIRVRYVAGYGAAATSVPGRFRQALLLAMGHWYENREAVNIGNIVNTLPMAVDALLLSDRGW